MYHHPRTRDAPRVSRTGAHDAETPDSTSGVVTGEAPRHLMRQANTAPLEARKEMMMTREMTTQDKARYDAEMSRILDRHDTPSDAAAEVAQLAADIERAHGEDVARPYWDAVER